MTDSDRFERIPMLHRTSIVASTLYFLFRWSCPAINKWLPEYDAGIVSESHSFLCGYGCKQGMLTTAAYICVLPFTHTRSMFRSASVHTKSACLPTSMLPV